MNESKQKDVGFVNLSRLLRLVKKNPVIYDFNNPDYYRKDVYEKAWSDISMQMNINGICLYIV